MTYHGALRAIAVAWFCGMASLSSGGALSPGDGASTPPAQVISFGEINLGIGDFGPLFESGFRYEATGSAWHLTNFTARPSAPSSAPETDGAALGTFDGIPPAVGQKVVIQREDGGLFTLDSLEIAGRLEGQRNDVVLMRGLRRGVQTAELTLQSSTNVFAILSPGGDFVSPIDALELELVESNNSALYFDDFTLRAVPEPSGLALVALLAWAGFGSPRQRGAEKGSGFKPQLRHIHLGE